MRTSASFAPSVADPGGSQGGGSDGALVDRAVPDGSGRRDSYPPEVNGALTREVGEPGGAAEVIRVGVVRNSPIRLPEE
jgi:hypothetical protein